MQSIIGSRKKSKSRKGYVFIDLKKAYDSIDRTLLFDILRKKCTNELENLFVDIVENIFKETALIYND